jgi:hypothetical protein
MQSNVPKAHKNHVSSNKKDLHKNHVNKRPPDSTKDKPNSFSDQKSNHDLQKFHFCNKNSTSFKELHFLLQKLIIIKTPGKLFLKHDLQLNSKHPSGLVLKNDLKMNLHITRKQIKITLSKFCNIFYGF